MFLYRSHIHWEYEIILPNRYSEQIFGLVLTVMHKVKGLKDRTMQHLKSTVGPGVQVRGAETEGFRRSRDEISYEY